MAKTIRAAGVVLLRGSGKSMECLLIHRPRHRDWSLPKGKLVPGESSLQAAVRECEEETGITPEIGVPLERQHYRVDGRPKTVDYWVARPSRPKKAIKFTPNQEVDKIQWAPIKTALKKITYKRDAKLVREAAELPRTYPLVLLRHAQAVKRSGYSGKDALRPLDDEGQRQARELRSDIAAYGVARCHSSDWTRCVETIRPFVKQSGTPLILEELMTEAACAEAPAATSTRFRELLERANRSVVCSHRPVLPTLLDEVAAMPDVGQEVANVKLKVGEYVVVHRYRRKHVWRVAAVELPPIG